MNDVLKLVKDEEEYLISIRRDFHSHPEVSLNEFRTAKRIEEELDSFGIEHRRIGETGVLGIIKGEKNSDKKIILRADIDALSITETNDVPYKSQNEGVMHACGHDIHAACLLTAAKILQNKRADFGGEIRLCFQQAEEIGAGALQFIAAGVTDGIDRVFGFHIASDLRSGVIGVKKGINNASADYFKINVKGKAAHVSTPEKGIDALYIASQITIALQALVTRRTSPIEPLIIGIGKLEAGTAYNIVAENAMLEGTVRATSIETRKRVKKEITDVVKQIASIYVGTAEIGWKDFTSPLVNDEEVCDEVSTIIERLWGKDSVIKDREVSLGGDDIAEFILKSKGAYAYLGTANEENPATCLPVHNGGFDVDESVLYKGAAMHVAYALEYLN